VPSSSRLTTSRRAFLASSVAFPFALRSFASPASANPHWILLGTGTTQGIFRAAWNPTTGELSHIAQAAATDHPSYLALHPTLPIVYAVNESPTNDGALAAFQIDPATATLAPLQRVSSGGNGPCFVSIDPSGRAAFSANYGSGSLAAFNLIGGTLKAAASVFHCADNPACGTLGPQKDRQDAAHMHCATLSPDNRFVLACNLGEDAIEIFPLDLAAAARQQPPLEAPLRVPTRPGSGPRHLAFHPNGRWLYCIHELDCTIDLYAWNVSNGTPAPILRQDSVTSTLASRTHLPGSTACELTLSPDGHLLYANTRGENSLVVYRIHPTTGLLTEQQRIQTGGFLTRYFTFDPSRRWLLCANQGSSTITVFPHDPTTGHITETPKTFLLDTPMFIQFL
jgi:6-phosphogluconolactonase